MALRPRSSKLKKVLLELSFLTLIVVVIWILFEIYWAYRQANFDQDFELNLEPFDNNLHLEAAREHQSREFLDPALLETLTLETVQSPTPDSTFLIDQTDQASPSSQINEPETDPLLEALLGI